MGDTEKDLERQKYEKLLYEVKKECEENIAGRLSYIDHLRTKVHKSEKAVRDIRWLEDNFVSVQDLRKLLKNEKVSERDILKDIKEKRTASLKLKYKDNSIEKLKKDLEVTRRDVNKAVDKILARLTKE